MTKKHIAALAAILLFATTGAEAQTTEWEIREPTDEWGDPDPARKNRIAQIAIQYGYLNAAGLYVRCDSSWTIFFGSIQPNLEEDWSRFHEIYIVPSKIDGIKGTTSLEAPSGNTGYARGLWNPKKITEVQESLEILFAWGRDGQRQSLTWTMDGLHETFAEACGE